MFFLVFEGLSSFIKNDSARLLLSHRREVQTLQLLLIRLECFSLELVLAFGNGIVSDSLRRMGLRDVLLCYEVHQEPIIVTGILIIHLPHF